MQARHTAGWMLTPQIPAIYTKVILGVARARGLDPAALIADAGLDAAVLADPAALVVPAEHLRLGQLILARTGNDGIGFDIGLALPLTTHGSLGFAVLCCGTLREAVHLLGRFWRLRERGAELQICEQDEDIVLALSAPPDLPLAVGPIFFECLLTVLFRSMQLLLGSSERIGLFALMGPEAAYHARYRDRLPPCCHDMPTYRFMVPKAVLDRPLPMANPEMLAQAVAQCERELALLEHPEDELLERVRAALVLTPAGYPSQAVLAEQLHMSLRTLRRRLQVCGTGYKELLEVARRRDALRLLETTALSIQCIATMLGYLNPTNFARAFRLWTGRSPREYRAIRPPE